MGVEWWRENCRRTVRATCGVGPGLLYVVRSGEGGRAILERGIRFARSVQQATRGQKRGKRSEGSPSERYLRGVFQKRDTFG